MRRLFAAALAVVTLAFGLSACEDAEQSPLAPAGTDIQAARVGTPVAGKGSSVDRLMESVNDQLAQRGAAYRLTGLWMFTTGWGRPDNRQLQGGTRWVPGDPGRAWNTLWGSLGYLQDPGDVTYAVDAADLTSDVSPGDAMDAIDAGYETWNGVENAFVDFAKMPVPPGNFDQLDAVPADPLTTCATGFFPAIVDPSAAGPIVDVYLGGWLPREYFDCLSPIPDEDGNTGGDFILGVTWTFTFVDGAGRPVDRNGDGYADTAFREQYYNEVFPWVTTGATFLGPLVDIESIIVHENGHALDLGHFGGPPPPLRLHPNGRIFSPEAIMNPGYAGGEKRVLRPIDEAGIRILYADGVGRRR
jgi:hypothetical protein